MNFLAHLYLSGNNEKLMVGNFIGDFVKGKKYENYPEPIKQGIVLHRQIDSFTDNHSRFREAKKLLVDDFGLYSGIIMDLYYDYLLAKNWNQYSNKSLREFAKWSHAVLLSNFFHLPKRVQTFLPFLIQNKRLESYARKDGIKKTLETMSKYTSLPDKAETAINILILNQNYFDDNFNSFMVEMIDFVESESGIEIEKPDFSIRL